MSMERAKKALLDALGIDADDAEPKGLSKPTRFNAEALAIIAADNVLLDEIAEKLEAIEQEGRKLIRDGIKCKRAMVAKLRRAQPELEHPVEFSYDPIDGTYRWYVPETAGESTTEASAKGENPKIGFSVH